MSLRGVLMKRSDAGQNGYTILELIVVTLIICVLIALIIFYQ
jgi:prepilin-type N-terminal cleavage/methylation domain-containing protein